jgi:hypothetical protein
MFIHNYREDLNTNLIFTYALIFFLSLLLLSLSRSGIIPICFQHKFEKIFLTFNNLPLMWIEASLTFILLIRISVLFKLK